MVVLARAQEIERKISSLGFQSAISNRGHRRNTSVQLADEAHYLVATLLLIILASALVTLSQNCCGRKLLEFSAIRDYVVGGRQFGQKMKLRGLPDCLIG